MIAKWYSKDVFVDTLRLSAMLLLRKVASSSLFIYIILLFRTLGKCSNINLDIAVLIDNNLLNIRVR